MLKGFKDFITRGNVMELAIAVIIGAAFTAIVTAISDSLIQPLINCFGGAEVDGFSKTLSSLDISIQPSDFAIIFVLGLVLVVLVMALASSNLLFKHPKELLLDSE